MYFKQIKLENFRNYGNQTIEFHEKLNLLLGQNAQGKTNLLESLFIMGLGKSFRTNKDSDMIAFGKDFARASCVVDGEKDETSIDILYQKEGKIIKVDGVKLSRSIDLHGNTLNFYATASSNILLNLSLNCLKSQRNTDPSGYTTAYSDKQTVFPVFKMHVLNFDFFMLIKTFGNHVFKRFYRYGKLTVIILL